MVLAEMVNALPGAFCDSETTYFRSCFRLTREQCESAAAVAAKPCVREVAPKMPRNVRSGDESTWSLKVGLCAGGRFEAAHGSEKIDSPICDDPDAWMWSRSAGG